MNYLRTMLFVCAVVILSCSVLKDQQQRQALDEGQAMKSVHLLNLPSGITESQLASAFSELNKAFSELGYPEYGYRLWKVRGESEYNMEYIKEYMYLWEGCWPSRAAYEAIHGSEAWGKAFYGNQAIFQAVMQKGVHVYQQYLEVDTAFKNR